MKTCFLFLFAGGLVLGATESALGQMVTTTTRSGSTGRIGQFVTTTIDVLQAPPVLGKQAFGKATATGVVLPARDWRCGRYFTDDLGRRWVLVYGLPYTEKPEAISRLVDPDGKRWAELLHGHRTPISHL